MEGTSNMIMEYMTDAMLEEKDKGFVTNAQFKHIFIDWHHEPNLRGWNLTWFKLVKSKIRIDNPRLTRI